MHNLSYNIKFVNLLGGHPSLYVFLPKTFYLLIIIHFPYFFFPLPHQNSFASRLIHLCAQPIHLCLTNLALPNLPNFTQPVYLFHPINLSPLSNIIATHSRLVKRTSIEPTLQRDHLIMFSHLKHYVLSYLDLFYPFS